MWATLIRVECGEEGARIGAFPPLDGDVVGLGGGAQMEEAYRDEKSQEKKESEPEDGAEKRAPEGKYPGKKWRKKRYK